MGKKKLKMICLRDPNYNNVVTLERYKNGDTDRNGWWYLDGELERMCGYDKATVYNLSERPDLRKETLDWERIEGDKATKMRSYTKHFEIHVNGEIEVEVDGVEEECVGIFWTTRETLVKTDRGIKFPVWDQRGLVCLKSDTESIERARRKRSQRTENL